MSITVESPPFTPTSPRGGLVARCIAPLKFTGKTRRDRSRIHHGDDLRGPPEIRHAARGCPRRPRSSAILLHANPPPVYEPWRSFEENDEPRVGLPVRSFILFLLVSLLSRASDKMLRASRSRFQEDALRAIYESLYRLKSLGSRVTRIFRQFNWGRNCRAKNFNGICEMEGFFAYLLLGFFFACAFLFFSTCVIMIK